MSSAPSLPSDHLRAACDEMLDAHGVDPTLWPALDRGESGLRVAVMNFVGHARLEQMLPERALVELKRILDGRGRELTRILHHPPIARVLMNWFLTDWFYDGDASNFTRAAALIAERRCIDPPQLRLALEAFSRHEAMRRRHETLSARVRAARDENAMLRGDMAALRAEDAAGVFALAAAKDAVREYVGVLYHANVPQERALSFVMGVVGEILWALPPEQRPAHTDEAIREITAAGIAAWYAA
jgi:hypothetical protein